MKFKVAIGTIGASVVLALGLVGLTHRSVALYPHEGERMSESERVPAIEVEQSNARTTAVLEKQRRELSEALPDKIRIWRDRISKVPRAPSTDLATAVHRVVLHFIRVPSADFAVQRVATRVAMGGHSIPERDIRRRFERGLKLFDAVYKLEVPEWYQWLSDSTGLGLVGTHELPKP